MQTIEEVRRQAHLKTFFTAYLFYQSFRPSEIDRQLMQDLSNMFVKAYSRDEFEQAKKQILDETLGIDNAFFRHFFANVEEDYANL